MNERKYKSWIFIFRSCTRSNRLLEGWISDPRGPRKVTPNDAKRMETIGIIMFSLIPCTHPEDIFYFRFFISHVTHERTSGRTCYGKLTIEFACPNYEELDSHSRTWSGFVKALLWIYYGFTMDLLSIY